MINFLKYRWLYFLISAVVILSGIFSIFKWGYKVSIDFVGGTNIEYSLEKKIIKSNLDKAVKNSGLDLVSSSVYQNGKQITLKLKTISDSEEKKLREELSKQTRGKVAILKYETVGPVLGHETMVKTLIASLLAVAGILIYMTFAFKGVNFAIAGIAAMVHDLLVIVGVYSLMSHFFGAELDLLFVTAVLTTMSFSIHDTIVIFDKIREYKKFGMENLDYDVNKALTETMVRSVNNSMTILFMLLALTLLGGSMIRFFVATLLVGTITGTYSSPFVATPILVILEKITQKRNK